MTGPPVPVRRSVAFAAGWDFLPRSFPTVTPAPLVIPAEAGIQTDDPPVETSSDRRARHLLHYDIAQDRETNGRAKSDLLTRSGSPKIERKQRRVGLKRARRGPCFHKRGPVMSIIPVTAWNLPCLACRRHSLFLCGLCGSRTLHRVGAGWETHRHSPVLPVSLI